MKSFIAAILAVFALAVFGIAIKNSVSLKQNCTGYLERAANASTVETAKEQLQKGIKYLEENNITSGYTSIFYQTPDEDVEYWYHNLKSSESELMKVDSTSSSVEKTNLLMKLRETLLDHDKDGDSLTAPKGLSRHPNNQLWCVLLSVATLIISALGIIYKVIGN
jgi:hypothetical protein